VVAEHIHPADIDLQIRGALVPAVPAARSRPDVTQKGIAMIGDLRTDALHQALADTPIEDETLAGAADPRLRRRQRQRRQRQQPARRRSCGNTRRKPVIATYVP